jgi:hypothetical protein
MAGLDEVKQREKDIDRREKRFVAAVAAMNGILANNSEVEFSKVAQLSVQHADLLLAELEKTK